MIQRSKPYKRLHTILLAFICAALLVVGFPSGVDKAQAAGSNTDKFYNPIKTVANDPYVMYKDNYYYYIESWDGGIWIWKSPYKDLTHMESGGTKVKVWTYPTSGPNCSGVWAPELHYLSGKWYIYYAATTCDNNNDNHRMFVLEGSTQDPQGTYIDKGKIYDSTDKWAIDGSVLTSGGSLYFIWSGWAGNTNGQQNLYIAPMSNPWTISGARVLISTPTQSWEKMGGNGTPDAPYINEGPTALVKTGVTGTINIVYSASGSWTDDYCYGLLTNTSGNMLNASAWVKKSTPVFSKTSEVFGPGHGSFTKSPDGTEDWMIYHSARKAGSQWDRMMNAQKFTWNADNTPNFGSPVSPAARQVVPSGQPLPNTYDWGDSYLGSLENGNWTYSSSSAARSDTKEGGWRQTFRGNTVASTTNYTVQADAKWLQTQVTWGNSGTGTPTVGSWKYWSQTSMDSNSLGNGWQQTFRDQVLLNDYTFMADAKMFQTGTTSQFPKYGVYAIYKDSSNYAVAMIDQKNYLLATYGVVNGVSQPWQNASLPAGLNLSTFNTIKVKKSGSNFQFYVQNQLLQTRSFNIDYGQVGLLTEDTVAHYINVNVHTGVSAFPKYGIYALYKNSNNYVVATIDQTNRYLNSFAVVNGIAQAWQDTPLPVGIDLSLYNTIKAVKTGSNFQFYINNQLLQTRTFTGIDMANGQVGLLTEDTKADFVNVSSY